MALLTSSGMFGAGWCSVTEDKFYLMLLILSSMSGGRWFSWLPVALLKAQTYLLPKSSKNSRGSGNCLGVGANLSPSSKATIWLLVNWWEGRLSTGEVPGLISEGLSSLILADTE